MARVRTAKGRFERSIDDAERDARACRLRAAGVTYQQIADQLGYSDRAAAGRAVERVLIETVSEPAETLRSLELARLDELMRRAWRVLSIEHVTVSAGRVVTVDGMPVPDHGPVLAAIDRILRISERRARLLGLDAPTQMQVITVDQIEAEIQRLSAELGVSSEGPR